MDDDDLDLPGPEHPPRYPAPQRCGSCGGQINPTTFECRCSG